MNTYVALLRGINVGGRNSLPMKELVAILEGLGLNDVATYIQSGNAVFRAESLDPKKLASDIAGAIGASRGFTPRVLVLNVDELRDAIDSNPFPDGESDPKSLHLYFMDSPPANPDTARLATLQSASERFELLGNVFYLHAPEGIGRSKLAANVEKALGVDGTGRNWRSVKAISALATKNTL